MVIKQITFSPTGGTKRVADAVSKGIGTDIECIELCVLRQKHRKFVFKRTILP